MKEYQKPELKLISLDNTDILTSSLNAEANGDGGMHISYPDLKNV